MTGGSAAGTGAGLRYYAAVLRAARRRAGAVGGSSSTGDQYYVVSDAGRAVRGGPAASPTELHASRGERIVRVRAGTLVVRGEADPSTHKPATTYYVINEAPAVAGTELRHVGAGSAAPSVSFDLTPAGSAAFHDLTRTIAHRGRAKRAVQHFAAVLDGELLTVPLVDYHQSPDGFTITKGVEIEGGFTKRSARDLALLLRLGPLPVVRLRMSS